MDSSVALVSFVTRAENRVAVLRALSGGARTRRALQDETTIPRTTLSRILADFRDRGLVVREGHEYRTTALGDLLATDLESLFASVAAMVRLQDVSERLAVDELDVPVAALADADVVVPDPADPLAPVRRAESLLAAGSNVRVLAHSVVPGCLEAVWRGVVVGSQTLEWVTTADAIETVRTDSELATWARELFDSANAEGYVHPDDVLPLVFVIDETVFVVVSDEAGTIQGHVETTDETVHEWADATVDAYVREATPIERDALTT